MTSSWRLNPRQVEAGPPRIGSLGRLRHVDLLGPLDRLGGDNLPRTRTLGRSRQLNLLGHLD